VLERKIVRLIIMSNISRRQFLKSAGVAALAVAALTGCKKLPDTDIPDVPGVTSVDLRVLFVDEKGNPVGNSVTGVYETTVLKDAKKYDPKLIPADKLPKGYELISEDEVDITNNGNMNIALVPVKQHKEVVTSTKYVKVTFQNCDTGKQIVKQFKVAEDAKQITVADITVPEGWVLDKNSEDWYSDLVLGTGADAGLDIATRPCLCVNA
jgi:hypothetical protein